MAASKGKTVLITGGAGFIGSNLAERLLKEQSTCVRLFDNISRSGVDRNLDWLQGMARPGQLEVVIGDVRDRAAVRAATRGVDEIYHLAAQVAVTSSISDPTTDFNTNAMGTLNVLESARSLPSSPFVLFTSTNKVYGSLHGVPVGQKGTRYEATVPGFNGASEQEALDFHSPYGCSKGAADQYTRDYARIYGIDSVVFRMSCIAGPRQFGNEDQGWVAHFLYSVLERKTITVCGNGLQVRDVLHVYDLIDAMLSARAQRERTRGEVYNVGGGMQRTVSVIELLRECERRLRLPLHLRYTEVRPGDQPLYISNTAKLEAHTGWKARHSLDDILEDIETFWHNEIANKAVRPRGLVTNGSSLLTEGVA
jgi:CDP-paratose 2-epimerase